MAGDRKRKGTSSKKKAMIYKLEGRLMTNRNERAKVQRRKFIKDLRSAGLEVLLDHFTKCSSPKCVERILCNTVAPENLVGKKLYGGYCVRCGKASGDLTKGRRADRKALKRGQEGLSS